VARQPNSLFRRARESDRPDIPHVDASRTWAIVQAQHVKGENEDITQERATEIWLSQDNNDNIETPDTAIHPKHQMVESCMDTDTCTSPELFMESLCFEKL
jgi:hypothetical protein